MIRYCCTIPHQDADKILFKLGKHFARKVPVELTPTRADIRFAAGRCLMTAHAAALQLRLEAVDTQGSRWLIEVMDSHLALMLRQPTLQIDWQQEEIGPEAGAATAI